MSISCEVCGEKTEVLRAYCSSCDESAISIEYDILRGHLDRLKEAGYDEDTCWQKAKEEKT
tara:strand:+ start:749 stop:931 length:183 start_codon:yes stop_codon:yes gene_type:complete